MMRGNGGLQNVFLKRKVANLFEHSTETPPAYLESIGLFICDTLRQASSAKAPLELVDIGSGTGRTVLGLLRGFVKRSVPFRCLCFDVSQAMENLFMANLQAFPARSKVDFVRHDANLGLPKSVRAGRINCVSIVSVLQYLDDWRQFLRCCREVLVPNGGLLALAELRGWYRMLDGVFDSAARPDPKHRAFWQHYFSKRDCHAPWKQEVHFARMSPALRFCETDMGMRLAACRDFQWSTSIAWSEVLRWIEIGVVSSLGSGLGMEARLALAADMKGFLDGHAMSLDAPFSVRWGFRIHLFRRV